MRESQAAIMKVDSSGIARGVHVDRSVHHVPVHPLKCIFYAYNIILSGSVPCLQHNVA